MLKVYAKEKYLHGMMQGWHYSRSNVDIRLREDGEEERLQQRHSTRMTLSANKLPALRALMKTLLKITDTNS